MKCSSFEYRAIMLERHQRDPSPPPVFPGVTPGRRATETRRISLASGVLPPKPAVVAARGGAQRSGTSRADSVAADFGFGDGGSSGGAGSTAAAVSGGGGGGGGDRVPAYRALPAETPASVDGDGVRHQLESFHRANLGMLSQANEKVAKAVVGALQPKLEVRACGLLSVAGVRPARGRACGAACLCGRRLATG